MNHQKEKYITYRKEAIKTQNKLQCYLALKREYILANYLSTIQSPSVRKVFTVYRLSEYSLVIETGRHRQSWLPEKDRLCSQCDRGQVETELHFLTSCPKYQISRQKYFTQTCPEFESKTDTEKLPYLLGEIPKCLISATKFICCCNELRTTSGHWDTQQIHSNETKQHNPTTHTQTTHKHSNVTHQHPPTHIHVYTVNVKICILYITCYKVVSHDIISMYHNY